MINSIEDLRSGGVLPTGPVSAWPQERNVAGEGLELETRKIDAVTHDTEVKASLGAMAKGAIGNAMKFARNGKVSFELREERMATCKSCPHFIEQTKRCSECGCFMEAKTWIAGDPKILCPKAKWAR